MLEDYYGSNAFSPQSVTETTRMMVKHQKEMQRALEAERIEKMYWEMRTMNERLDRVDRYVAKREELQSKVTTLPEPSPDIVHKYPSLYKTLRRKITAFFLV